MVTEVENIPTCNKRVTVETLDSLYTSKDIILSRRKQKGYTRELQGPSLKYMIDQKKILDEQKLEEKEGEEFVINFNQQLIDFEEDNLNAKELNLFLNPRHKELIL
jgi:hypothetical protein